MRIHTDSIRYSDLLEAAKAARVEVEITTHGSRKRDHAFNVNLTGESKRRPNRSHASDEYAATWDQWGVFIGHLFLVDENAVFGSMYDGVDEFNFRTDHRFVHGWPKDAHGDHRFKYSGLPYTHQCTKCSATQRWQ